jgi:hypothetical protein
MHRRLFVFHDSVWEGSATHKGSADVLAEIDKLAKGQLIVHAEHMGRRDLGVVEFTRKRSEK